MNEPIKHFSSGQSATLNFTISDEDLIDFSRLSGDYNSIHLDSSKAQAMGFENKVVYGALIIAKLSQLIGMEIPGSSGVLSTLKMEFRNPLYAGEEASMLVSISKVSEATRSITINVEVTAAGKLIANGSVLATLPHHGGA